MALKPYGERRIFHKSHGVEGRSDGAPSRLLTRAGFRAFQRVVKYQILDADRAQWGAMGTPSGEDVVWWFSGTTKARDDRGGGPRGAGAHLASILIDVIQPIRAAGGRNGCEAARGARLWSAPGATTRLESRGARKGAKRWQSLAPWEQCTRFVIFAKTGD